MKKGYVRKMTSLLLCAAVMMTSFPADVRAEAAEMQAGQVQSKLMETYAEQSETAQGSSPQDASVSEASQEGGSEDRKEETAIQENGLQDGGEVGAFQENTPQGGGENGASETVDGSGETQRTDCIDWTNRTEDLKLEMNSAVYQAAGEEKVIEASAGRLDLSGTALSEDEKLKLGITFELLRDSNGLGEFMQAGDTFSIDFSSVPFLCDDSVNPQEIQDAAGNVIAIWTSQENRVTVTFQEPVPAVGSKAEFYIEIKVKQDALQDKVSESELLLQVPEGMEAVKTVIVLPGKRAGNQENGAGYGIKDPGTEETKIEEPETTVPEQNTEEKKDNKKTEAEKGQKEEAKRQEEERTIGKEALYLSVGRLFTGRIGEADKVITKSIIKNPKEGIKKAVISVGAQKDGYSNAKEGTAFDFGMSITIDSTYLGTIANQFAEDPDYPQFDMYEETGDGYKQFQKDVDAFFEKNADVPELSYTLPLGKGYLLDKDGSAPELKKYITEDGNFISDAEKNETNEGTIIGTVTFTKSAAPANELNVSIEFKKRVYNRSDIILSFSQELFIARDMLDDQDKTVSWKESQLQLIPVGSTGGDTGTDNQPYTVDKSGPKQVTKPEISYTLTFLAPTGKSLDGMMMEEVLPTVPDGVISGGQKYLDVTSLSVNGVEVKEGGSGYKIQDGKLQYIFPKGQNLTYAEAVLVVNMTEAQKNALTQQYSQNPDSPEETVLRDKANLYDKPESNIPAASSEEVATTVKLDLLSKSGSQDSINGDRFHWTVDVNTEFIGYSIKGAYLIDYINNTAHTYNDDAGVKVSVDGGNSRTLPLTYLGNAEEAVGRPDALGTLEAVESLIAVKGWGGSIEDGQAYYYDCGDSSVMLIPYGSEFRGHRASFTYDTELKKPVPVTGANVKNDAKFVWNYLIGEGPGPGSPASFTVSVDKTGEAKPATGSKAGVGYDEKTRTAKWRFQVNYYPSSEKLKDVRIEETFNTSKQTLLRSGLSYSLWDRADASKNAKGSIREGSAGSQVPYYTYDDAAGDCVIYLGDIETTQYYDIRMNTKITDGTVLSAAGQTSPFTNRAALTAAGIGPDRPSSPIEGSVPVHTTWIQKDAAGKFDYKAKAFTWKTIVNPNHLKIKNPVVTDTLPADNSFGELTAVERISADGSPVVSGVKVSDRKFTVGSGGDTVPVEVTNTGANTEKISVGNADTVTEDTYILTYTTKVSDNAYQEFIKSNAKAGRLEFTNAAVLTGKYMEPGRNGGAETEYAVTSADDARNSFTGRMVLKDGQYMEGEGKIKWQVDVNVEQMKMQGFSVLEDLKGMPFLELDPESVEVYKVDIGQDGNVDDSSKSDVTSAFKGGSNLLDAAGFKFVIPAEYSTDTLRIIFDTYFTDSVLPSEVKNKITIKAPGADFSSNESNGNMSGDFDIDEYVRIAATPVLKILKISGNSVETGNAEKQLPLAGAQFTMKAYKESGGSYTEDAKRKRVVTSKANGNAVFVNLTPGTVYEILETKAPAGYTLVNEPGYYLFIGEGGAVPSGEKINVGGKDVSISDIVLFEQDPVSKSYKTDTGTFPSVKLKNSPDVNNMIRFTKVGKDETPLPANSAAFSLTPKDSGRITKNEWKEQRADASGAVTFNSIDAGADEQHKIAYILKEISNDNIQCDQGQTFHAEAWMAEGAFKYTITPKDVKGGNGNNDLDVAAVTGSQDTGYTIQNLYRTGKVTVKKIDAVTGDALYNSAGNYTFAIIDGMNPSGGGEPAVYGRASSKDASGKIIFGKVPYSENGYRIAELSTQPGYVMPLGETAMLGGKAYPIVQSISKAELDSAASSAAGEEGEKKPAFSIDYSTQADKAIKNERVKGTISFTKQNDGSAVLPDRTFQLWHVADNQDGSQDSYYKQAEKMATFRDAAEGKDKKAWLIAKAVSDGAGEVRFTAANELSAPDTPIAWGEYYITEKVVADDLYRPVTGNTAIHISKDDLLHSISGDKTSHDAAFAYRVKSGVADGIVCNQLKGAALKLKKIDKIAVEGGQTKKDALKDVEFHIEGQDYYNNEVKKSGKTDSQGELTLSGLPVSKQNADDSYQPYILTETRQQGYKEPKAYKVYVTPGNAENVPVNDAKIWVVDSRGERVYDSTKPGDIFEIDNEPIYGTLTFKKTASSAIGAFNNKAVEGAEFTLKRVIGGAEYVAADNVKSNEDGEIIFENIEFGNYRLYETEAPKGMQAIASGNPKRVAEISKELIAGSSEFAGGAAPEAYHYVHTSDISNTMVEKALEFRKTDEDGNALAGVNFDVYRRGNSVKADGSDMMLIAPDSMKTYGAYLVLPSVTSAGGTGEFSMTLPYGDYLLVERNADIGQGDADKTAVWIAVREGGVTVRQNDAMAFEQGKTEVLPNDEGWKALDKKDGKYTVINYMKARITLKKVEDEEHGYAPVAGAQFRLEYKASEGDEYAVLEDLITDADGIIRHPGLSKGFYRLTETANIGYDVSRPFAGEFEVRDSDRRRNIDLTTDRLAPLAGSEGAFAEGKGIVNTRLAGSVTLNKVDGEKTDEALEGVMFTLYRQKDADGLWDKISEFFTGKRYEAAGQEIAGQELATKGTLTIEGLEWGSYKLTETKAKDGYKNDGKSLPFTISREGTKDIILETDGHDIYNYQNEVIIRKTDKETKALLSGAEFTVTEHGKTDVAYSGTTGDGTNGTELGILRIQGILTGGKTYVLHEQGTPEGYSPSEDITFLLKEDGTVKIGGKTIENQVITVENSRNKLRFTKAEKYNESCSDPALGAASPDKVRGLAGAEFTLFTDEGCTEKAVLADGHTASAVSGTDGSVVMDDLLLGENGIGRSYYLKETKAPDGYVSENTVYRAELDERGHVQIFDADGERLKDDTVINDVRRADIRFTKVDDKNHDRILPGSMYGLYKDVSVKEAQGAEGFALQPFAAYDVWESLPDSGIKGNLPDSGQGLRLIATAVTDEKGVLTFKGVLMDTVYVIRELQEPNGSLVSANPISIRFSLDENGETEISYFDDGSGTAGIDPETNEIKWYEPQTEICFAKRDEKGNLLRGAALQAEDAGGNVIESWISSDEETHLIRGVLKAGKTYRLVETMAPEGYQIAEPVEFTVDDTPAGPDENRVQYVEMVDKAIEKVTPPSPEEEDKHEKPEDTQGSVQPDDPKGTKVDLSRKDPISRVSPQVKKVPDAAKTGDYTSYTLWLMLFLGAGVIVIGAANKKKK